MLLQDLDNDDLLNWVNYEIEGYPDDVEIPDYRVIGGQLYGSYFKGSMANHMKYNHVPLPLGNMPSETKEDILTVKNHTGHRSFKGNACRKVAKKREYRSGKTTSCGILSIHSTGK